MNINKKKKMWKICHCKHPNPDNIILGGLIIDKKHRGLFCHCKNCGGRIY